MARAKKTAAQEKPKRDPSKLDVDGRFLRDGDKAKYEAAEDEEQRQVVFDALKARAMTMPEMRSASIVQKFEGDSVNLMSAIDELSIQVAKVNGGDMSRPEAMLLSQAHALDALFSNLARRAHANMGEGYLPAAETYMRLALRAQSQCTRTIEALSAIKNPPVVYAKQMNVTTGPQQVNNGVATNAPAIANHVAHTLENESDGNKLGGMSHELLPDTRTQEVVSRTMPSTKTLAEVHRTED